MDERGRALAAIFDDATLMAIETAVQLSARMLESLSNQYPEMGADAERLQHIRYMFVDAIAAREVKAG